VIAINYFIIDVYMYSYVSMK